MKDKHNDTSTKGKKNDLATIFLDTIFSKNNTLNKEKIQTAKNAIDVIFINKFVHLSNPMAFRNLFNNYIDFYDVYQEFNSISP